MTGDGGGVGGVGGGGAGRLARTSSFQASERATVGSLGTLRKSSPFSSAIAVALKMSPVFSLVHLPLIREYFGGFKTLV